MITRPDAVDEAPFWVEVSRQVRVASWTCSPERLEALAVGWLRAEGFIAHADDLNVDRAGGRSGRQFGIRAAVDPTRAREAERHRRARRESGISPLYYVQHAPELLHGHARTLPLPSPDAVAALFRELYAPGVRPPDGRRPCRRARTAAAPRPRRGRGPPQRRRQGDRPALLAGADLGGLGS